MICVVLIESWGKARFEYKHADLRLSSIGIGAYHAKLRFEARVSVCLCNSVSPSSASVLNRPTSISRLAGWLGYNGWAGLAGLLVIWSA
jgi:hypothetical protein